MPTTLNPSFTTTFDPASGVVELKLAVDSGVKHQTVEFDRFGEAGSTVGLDLRTGATHSEDVSTRVQGTLGLQLNPSAGSAEVKPSLGATVDFNDTDLNVASTLGPLDAPVVHGTSSLHVTTALVGSGDGVLSAAELAAAGALATTGSGTYAASLPLTVGFAGQTLPGARIDLASPNVFTQRVTFSTTTPQFEKLFNLGRISTAEVLDFLTDSGTFAKKFSSWNCFSASSR